MDRPFCFCWENLALCKISPLLLPCFYFTTTSASGAPPTRDSAQLFAHSAHIMYCMHTTPTLNLRKQKNTQLSSLGNFPLSFSPSPLPEHHF